ncbi:ATP-dependent RNA helicase DDX24-like isoform X2 [Watersipora subatra]|uniref:ATP-dependent RNA helicase DDX24-like isoform X2 n=1 Tax=Watersipora subatra TaxID=2589382 RepID=UPI00355B8E46
MSSMKLRALSPWKKIKVNSLFDNNPEFEGFGGIEVLENYDLSTQVEDDVPIKDDTVKLKTKRTRKALTSPGTDEEAADTKKSRKENVTKKKKSSTMSQKKEEGESIATGETEKNENNGRVEMYEKYVGVTELREDNLTKKKSNSMLKKKKEKARELVKSNDDETVEMDSQEESLIKRKPNLMLKKRKEAEELEKSGDDETVEIPDMDGWKGLFVPTQVLRSLADLGFKSPTLIQALALPAAIRDRQDILGAAETGSGKTLAFGIPLIYKIMKMKADSDDQGMKERVYALVLTPTRELCVQVRDHLLKAAYYTDISVVAVFGGMSAQKQVRLLKSRPEIVVATPGRLWDIMNDEEVGSYLSTVVKAPLLVLDEADKMVEKGHFEELTKILTLMKGDEESSRRRQCFVFSATLTYVHLPPERIARQKKKKKKRKRYQISKESKLDELIDTVGILKKPKIIDLTEKTQTASKLVESSIFCTQSDKDLYLYYFLKRHPGRTLIFTNSIDCIRRLLSVFSLVKQTLLPLHASMHQKQRLKNLERFTASETGVLIATDVAARGLDIPNIQHVIHYQVPRTAESYVHRSGRTARALKDGLSVMFVDEKDVTSYKKILKSLEKDDSVSQFPVDQTDLRIFRPIISLAQRIDSTQHRSDKVKREDDWFVKMAKEADLGYSDEDSGSDMEKEEQRRKKQKDQRKLEAMKSELAGMLTKGSGQTTSYRGKYPTVSGKLDLPKTIAGKKDTQAITLVSRKRRP